jgi:hypothetical protein
VAGRAIETAVIRYSVASRVLIAILCCGAGCTFRVDGLALDGEAPFDAAAPSDLASDGAAPDLTASDFAPPADLTPSPDLLVPFCGEPNLVACYEFEDGAGATVARDGTANHNDLTLTVDTESPTGHTGGALLGAAGGLAHIPHNASFDVAELTVEAWINPSSLPPTPGSRAGVLDEDGQYGLFIYQPGTLTCFVGGGALSSAQNTIMTSAWQHVACTYDLTTIRLYYNGREIANTPNTNAILTNQPNGMCVSSNSPNNDNFLGLVDEVRLFGVARAAGDLCRDAGAQGCS